MSEIPERRYSPNAHFLIGEIQSGESEKGRLGGGMAASLVWHIGAVLFVVFMITRMPPPAPTSAPPERMPEDVIWLSFSHDGRWLVTSGEDNRFRLWRLQPQDR